MRVNERRREEDRHHCEVHYQFVQEVSRLNSSIAVIGEGVKWMKQIGRWVIPTLLALCLAFGGSMVTIAVKVAELDKDVKSINKFIEEQEDPNGG